MRLLYTYGLMWTSSEEFWEPAINVKLSYDNWQDDDELHVITMIMLSLQLNRYGNRG